MISFIDENNIPSVYRIVEKIDQHDKKNNNVKCVSNMQECKIRQEPLDLRNPDLDNLTCLRAFRVSVIRR